MNGSDRYKISRSELHQLKRCGYLRIIEQHLDEAGLRDYYIERGARHPMLRVRHAGRVFGTAVPLRPGSFKTALNFERDVKQFCQGVLEYGPVPPRGVVVKMPTVEKGVPLPVRFEPPEPIVQPPQLKNELTLVEKVVETTDAANHIHEDSKTMGTETPDQDYFAVFCKVPRNKIGMFMDVANEYLVASLPYEEGMRLGKPPSAIHSAAIRTTPAAVIRQPTPLPVAHAATLGRSTASARERPTVREQIELLLAANPNRRWTPTEMNRALPRELSRSETSRYNHVWTIFRDMTQENLLEKLPTGQYKVRPGA